MTFGFAMLTAGTLLVYSGWNNSSIADTLKGLSTRHGGPGDTGFTSLLMGAAPGTGGTGPVSAKGTPRGLTMFDGQPVCKWIADELTWARKHGWKGRLESGYRSKQHQAEVCATGVKPCAEPGKSNHQGKRFPKCAADVTNPEELDEVLSKKPGRRLKYTGRSIGDTPHFSSGLNGV